MALGLRNPLPRLFIYCSPLWGFSFFFGLMKIKINTNACFSNILSGPNIIMQKFWRSAFYPGPSQEWVVSADIEDKDLNLALIIMLIRATWP